MAVTSCFLSQGARLQLISSALCSMPLHHLCSIHIPAGVIKQLDRIIRQCLWRGNSDTPKQSLAAWDMICKPKNKGGLGITNFRHKNDALLIKYLHKFYNRADIPWVHLIWNAYYLHQIPHFALACGSFWWRDIMKLVNDYRKIAKPVL